MSLKIKDFNGVLYVKGYSKDERCRLVVHTTENQERPVDFTVFFGECGLVHVNVSIGYYTVLFYNLFYNFYLHYIINNIKFSHGNCINFKERIKDF